MSTRIQLRRGTAAQWTDANPILASGEPAVETDTGKRKIGDGVTAWADLPYDLTKAEADDLYATSEAVDTLTPGPGEVIVGGEDGPVRRQGDFGGPNRHRTISLVGDLHLGYGADAEQQAAAGQRIESVFSDLATIPNHHAARVYLGDMIDTPGTTGTTPGSSDQAFLSYANGLEDDWYAVVGNHDMGTQRTAEDWEVVYDRPRNWVADLGFCRIIGISPDTYAEASSIPESTLTFLEAEIARSRRDTIVVSHYPLWGTLMSNPLSSPFDAFGGNINPDGQLREIVDQAPHVRLWISAHRHPNMMTAPKAITHTWTGSRHIGHICVGAPVYTDYREGAMGDDPPRSIYLTMNDDHAVVQFRNHAAGVWEPFEHTYQYPISWSRPSIVSDLPALSLVGTFDGEPVVQDAQGAVTTTIIPAEQNYDSGEGRTGLSTLGGYIAVDPRKYLTAESGSIVVRARFTDVPGGNQYLAYHNPGGDERIYLIRLSDNRVAARIGRAAVSAYTQDEITSGIHTFGMSWVDGFAVLNYIDGELQSAGRSSATELSPITTIGPDIRFGHQSPLVIYEIALSDRELSPGEHAALHAAESWSLNTLS